MADTLWWFVQVQIRSGKWEYDPRYSYSETRWELIQKYNTCQYRGNTWERDRKNGFVRAVKRKVEIIDE